VTVHQEPTITEAADLIRSLWDSSPVERISRVHAAMLEAHRMGRAAERAAQQRTAYQAAARFSEEAHILAQAHAAMFREELAAAADQQQVRAEMPWPERVGAAV
jgi:hypothetical protein